MKWKKEYLILAGIIVVLLAYLILSGGRDKMSYQVPRLEALTAGEIDRIEISRKGETLALVGKDESWRISPQDYPADDVRVKDLLKAVENLTLTELAAENPNDQRYELDDEHRIDVTAFRGEDRLRAFSIGKTSSTYRHTFVRMENDDRVFYARESFRSDFEREVKDLRDKVVMALDSAEVSAFRIQTEDDAVEFKKTVTQPEPAENKEETSPAPSPTEAWNTEDGKTGDKSGIDEILRAVSDLRCDEFIEDKTPSDMTEPPQTTITLTGNKEYILRIFPKQEGEGGKYPALSSESDYVFLLSTYTAERLTKKPAELMKKPEEEDGTSG